MQTTYLLVVFAIVVQQTFAGEFPDFFKKCKVSDPAFDECISTNANTFMSTLSKGDATYGISSLLVCNETAIYNFTDKFNLKLTNVSAHSDEGYAIKNIHFDIADKLLTFCVKCSQIRRESNYEAVGEILGKPVHETGKLNMTFDDVELNVSIPLEFKTKDDKKYLEAVMCNVEATGKNFQFKPCEQVNVGEPMTDEQKKEYQTYIDKIPAILKSETEHYGKDILAVVNKIFETPFDEMFEQ